MGDKAAASYAVPVIDISNPDTAAVSRAMWEAANTVGFFTVTGHGIPLDKIDDTFECSREFFAQGLDAKEQQAPFKREFNSGYEHMKQVRPSTGLPDVKESMQITARGSAMEGRWPSTPGDFEGRTKGFMDAAFGLGSRILDLLEPPACPNNPPGTLAKSHTLWGEGGQCTLRMLNYPPQTNAQLKGLPPGSWRAGAHTDWCCITLLFQRMGESGLECAANPLASGGTQWAPVSPVLGGVAVNVGDMLSRWSDGRLLSNLHRVRMPDPLPEGAPADAMVDGRYSLAFFMQADKSAVIECSNHEPITAGDYILGRIKSNFTPSTNTPDAAAAAAK